MAKCTFIGLGTMGGPMARHLAAAGNDVLVWNRSAEKAVDWAGQNPGRYVPNLEEAVGDREFVFLCVGDDRSPTAFYHQGQGR